MGLCDKSIGFIGGGNMAFAIAVGLINKKVVNPNQIGVSGPHKENLKHWEAEGAYVTTDNNELIAKYDVIFICVKPKLLHTCMERVKNAYDHIKSPKDNEKIFVSVLAGVTLEKLKKSLSFIPQAKIVRTMPNTSVKVGEGIVIYATGLYINDADVRLMDSILSPLGLAEQVDEQMIDPITGISGCGPAFVYTIIEGLADGALKQGVPKAMALRLAAQTLLGASKTMLETQKHPAALRDEVCSPGGSTICGVYELEKGNLRATLMTAVEKAVEKSRQLGEK